ncbi:MAG: cell division protein FtsQ/DivIB [Pseudomonadota bacterium]
MRQVREYKKQLLPAEKPRKVRAKKRVRRDPAPSRLAYKLNRLMMRSGVQLFLRYGLPVLVLAAGAAFWASDPVRVEAAKDRVAELRRQVEERPEFMVHMMAVEDASSWVGADVREVLSLDFPISSFDLDLDALRDRVEELDAVAQASVHVKSGGVLTVSVTERVPVAVWRSREGLQLIDPTGHRVVGLVSRVERPELPLIVGEGADRAVAEALELYAASGPLEERLRGLLRVGERRWDVVLTRKQRILLPEEGALTALQKVLALHRAQDLLARDVAAVDFRNPARPVVRRGTSVIEGLFETDFDLTDNKDE